MQHRSDERLRSCQPKARTSNLLSSDLAGEIVLYDTQSKKAHCLSPLAAAVWRKCDGKTSTADLTSIVGEHFPGADDAAICVALEKLRRANLLDNDPDSPVMSVHTRRQVVRRMALAGCAIAVVTMSAPLAEAANSCRTTGHPCAGNQECCSNVCIAGRCT